MLISVVTVSLNCRKGLEKTMSSLLSQICSDWEYIVVDGASSDGTVDYLRSQEQAFGGRLKWVSEPDGGIYDAMNKGLAMASGSVVGFLGGGDTFFDEYSLKAIVDEFDMAQVDAVYGDLVFVRADDYTKVCRYWRGSQYRPGIFDNGWQPAHPTFFCHKVCFCDYGGFDTSLRVSADFDLMLRFIERHHISNRYITRTLIKMVNGGESNGSLRNIIIAHRNIYRSFNKYGYKVPPFYSLRRLLPKILNMLENSITGWIQH